MNVKKYTLFFSTLLTIAGIGALATTSDVQASSIVAFDCNPSSDRLEEVNTTAKFNAYLESLDLKTQITVKGKVLKANKDLATTECLIVYGTHKDVTNLSTNYYDSATKQWKYIGFDVTGNPYPNVKYPDFKGSIDFVKTRNFIKTPWTNSGLLSNLGTKPKPVKNTVASPRYVNPKTGKTYTKEQELNRAVDRFWLQYCGSSKNCKTKGDRGYFPSVNNYTKKTMEGKYLLDYASIQSYPTAYTAGTFDLYHKGITAYWHATFYMPPHVTLFGEERDLALTIKNIQTPVVEGEKFNVTYQVCNYGQNAVKNPTVSYGIKNGTYKTTTVNTTLKSGTCTGPLTLTDTAPSVSKQTKYDYELIVNKDNKNPKGEKDLTNNKDSKPLTVKPSVKDLALTIKKIQSPVVEGGKFQVTYEVCNYGDSKVENPVVSFGMKDGKYQTTTIKTTLNPGKCTSQTLTDTAPSVSKDTNFNYELIVNNDKKNPTGEKDYTNNKDNKPLKVLDDIINGSVSIKDHTPDTPHSNGNVTVKVEVCNHSFSIATNVQVSYGFNKGETATTTIKSINAQDCVEINHNTKAPEINKSTGNVVYTATLDKFKGDSDPSDDKDTKKIKIVNPDAKVTISASAGSSSQVNDINVKFTNNMLSSIKNQCGNAAGTIACKGGNAPTGTQVKIYDTKFTDSTSDDVLVKTYYPTFSIEAGKSATFKIKSDDLVNYVKNNYKTTYQLVEFRVEAQIPHYQGEVDYKGNPSYDNNRDVDTLVYYPERPNIAATKCNVLDHPITTYFTTPDGYNPIKMCAGHYPTYPSTTIESGMQAYHYVLYRFFPSPIPKYTVTTPEADSSNPNHFTQIFDLPSSEEANQRGDFESMYFPNKTVNGYYQERGRYMPTGGTFNFKVYENRGKGETIAIGTVSYKIPTTCYNSEKLDIKHQYGCDEILFFLPNYDTASKHEKPANYNTNNKVVYPIKNTKIPYLNPGSYTFEFKATETFKYYYQMNESTSGYEWSKPKFK